MYQFKPDKSNIIITVRGKGNLDKKNISTESGQAIARFIMTERPDLSHNLMEVDGTGKKVKAPEMSVNVELKKKEATSLTSKVVKSDGNNSLNNEPKSESNELKPTPEKEKVSYQGQKSAASVATKKRSPGRPKRG